MLVCGIGARPSAVSDTRLPNYNGHDISLGHSSDLVLAGAIADKFSDSRESSANGCHTERPVTSSAQSQPAASVVCSVTIHSSRSPSLSGCRSPSDSCSCSAGLKNNDIGLVRALSVAQRSSLHDLPTQENSRRFV